MSCEHPYVARNGTTFSGRKMKYVVHCSSHAGQVGSNYLTPTQRAQQQIRRLKELLCTTRQDLEQRDTEILRLTREVVELRLFKASLSSPDERSASSDAVTVREADLKTSQDVSPIVDMVDDAQKSSSPRHHAHIHHRHAASLQQQHLQHGSSHHVMHVSSEMQSSFADSGHFEDLTSSSVHSKDSSFTPPHTHDQACGSDEATGVDDCISLEQYELQRQELIRLYEQRIEDLIRNQDANTSEIKRTNNDRIEALLQKLAECNTRYADIVPDYEHAKERIRELEKQLEDLQRKLVEHEEKQKQMYLHMYQKGQEAERIARADQVLELAHRAPQNKVSINELLHQLQSTQDELENIRVRVFKAAECRNECGSNHALLTAKEAISLWVLGARKICLPQSDIQSLAGNIGLVVGWRDSNRNASGLTGTNMRYISLSIMNNTECAIRYAQYSENFEDSIVITPTEFCSQSRTMNDVCEGDSGGPFISINSFNRCTLVAIVAFAPSTNCGQSNLPGVYMRISSYTEWITSNIKITRSKS
ncbi:hypothetical protein GQX74_010557 [Glossina fuscipes]|nr:hypothetical protein GQX74_010557 [Glossina fuscipes]